MNTLIKMCGQDVHIEYSNIDDRIVLCVAEFVLMYYVYFSLEIIY